MIWLLVDQYTYTWIFRRVFLPYIFEDFGEILPDIMITEILKR